MSDTCTGLCPICQNKLGFIREASEVHPLMYKAYCHTCERSFSIADLTELGYKFREPLLQVGV